MLIDYAENFIYKFKIIEIKPLYNIIKKKFKYY
jgi:hypothetical protein